MYHPCLGAELVPISAEIQAMFDWSTSKGIKWPKIAYPVRFPPGYIGSMALEDIYPGESIIISPNEALLTTKVAIESNLQTIYEENKDLYDPTSGYYDDLVLSTYLIYEKFKGPASK